MLVPLIFSLALCIFLLPNLIVFPNTFLVPKTEPFSFADNETLSVFRLKERVPVAHGPQQRAANILEHGHPGEDISDLKAPTEALTVNLIGLQIADVFPMQQNRAAGRLVLAGNDVEHCRLKGKGGTG